MFDVYWWIISRSEPSTPILFASLRTVGHSAPGIKFATHHQLQSMSMPGRSSRSRRRWSISWRSTRCPTASTATGQAVTAATGWRDIGVRLQPVWFNLFFFRGELSSAAGDQSPVGPRERVQPLPERRKHRQLLLPFYPQQASGSSTSLAFQW